MTKQHYFDTGALYSEFNLVKEALEKGESVYIPHTVMLEISNKKDGYGYINKVARDTQKELLEMISEEKLFVMDESIYEKSSDRLSMDHIIVKEIFDSIRYKIDTESFIHTGDRDVAILSNIKIKNKCIDNVVVKLYNQNEKILTTDYSGYRVITDDEIISKIWASDEDTINCLGLVANEYVVMKTGKKETILRWDDEKKELKHIGGNIKGVDALNTQQRMAIDLLSNKDIPIKIIAGRYGSGKTYLGTRYAWEDGRKIMLVRNALGDDSSENIGYLKGSTEDKLMPYFMSVIDNLPFGIMDFENRVRQGTLDYNATYFMKGRSLSSTIMMVDEAEDINLKTFKLLGSRLAKGSEIIFTGDVAQAESKHMKDNGLQQFINHESIKNSPLVGVVVLEDDVRSEASKVFADLI